MKTCDHKYVKQAFAITPIIPTEIEKRLIESMENAINEQYEQFWQMNGFTREMSSYGKQHLRDRSTWWHGTIV
ncbi:hypothetical protein [Paenibacillus sedimenti]|uniref:Uncharacterized protein n=1 Tax=Paenibacillus sedimenti TaxID=2770274 RepID=A0A926QKB0_9BACL|nr:hypothetical protein [Paenibacillus sedimenti]MBD0381297.1 hypothetical protein [Paenibacillus sedimenti]